MVLHRSDTDPGWINRRFRKIEREMQQMRAAKRLASSTIDSGGIHVKNGGGIFIEDGGGIRIVEGGGIRIEDGGGITITENGVIDIADGKIINKMLEAPVLPERVQASASNFSLTGGTYQDVVVATTEVPAGYTRMLAQVAYSVHARNTRGVQDYVAAVVGNGFVPITDVQPGYVGQVSHSAVDLQENLPPGEDAFIRLKALSGGGNWGADAFNGASIEALILWLR